MSEKRLSFRPSKSIANHIENIPEGEVSRWVNNACEEKLRRQKEPSLYYRDLEKLKRKYFLKISKITRIQEEIEKEIEIDIEKITENINENNSFQKEVLVENISDFLEKNEQP